MSETVEQVKTEEVVAPQGAANPFDEASWHDSQPEVKIAEVEQKAADPVVEQKKEDSHEYVDAEEWLKKTYGWENADAGKKELDELRKLKETAQTPAEIKFANEQSQKFFDALKEGKEDEVYAYLSQKRELSQVDALKPEDIIRLNIKYANPHFKEADVRDVFEEQYIKPTKPTQAEEEEDGDFNFRVQAWQQQVEKIDRKIERDAIAAKQELSKYNNELVLPDLPKTQQAAPSTEDITAWEEQFRTYRATQFQRIESEAKNFSGYNVKYKDEAVEIPITYTISEEEKTALIQSIKNEVLGETFDINPFFGKRWIGEDGNVNVNQMLADIYLLNNPEKVFQKFTNESATKRLEHKIKTDSNIVINKDAPQGTFNPDGRTESQKLAEFFWNQ